MAAQQSQHVFWEGQPSYNNEQQYLAALNCYEAPYNASTLSLLIPPEIQYAPLPFARTASYGSSTGWFTSGTEPSPCSEASTLSPNTPFLDPDYPPPGHNQNGRSNEAAQKRREQNRNSQIAHRQRSKKLVEDLRHEVEEYSEYSQDMYQTLQSLRETTKALVSTIEDALSRQPPMGRRFSETSTSGCRRSE